MVAGRTEGTKRLALMLVVAGMAACGTTTQPSNSTATTSMPSGTGQVTGVLQLGSSTFNRSPTPIPGQAILIEVHNEASLVMRGQRVESSGQFHMYVPVGRWSVHGYSPRYEDLHGHQIACSGSTITVTAGATTHVTITCPLYG